MQRSGRAIAMDRLLTAAKLSSAGDIQRAAMFLERAREIRRGCRQDRSESRASQASASRRRAAGQDNPMLW